MQILHVWLPSSSKESVSSKEPSIMLLLPMPLLADESRSNDSNILMSLIVNGSTVDSVRPDNDDSLVAIVGVGIVAVVTVLKISTDAMFTNDAISINDLIRNQLFFIILLTKCLTTHARTHDTNIEALYYFPVS